MQIVRVWPLTDNNLHDISYVFLLMGHPLEASQKHVNTIIMQM